MKHIYLNALLLIGLALPLGVITSTQAYGQEANPTQEQEPEKGPHRGRMLHDGDFSLELAIFETGVEPEFRVWASHQGKAIAAAEVELSIILTRLGGVEDKIGFKAENDYLRGDTVIYEPHSFVVTINASYQGKQYQWQYDNFEGRTEISAAVAKAMAINTEIAGPQLMHETLPVLGRLVLPPQGKSQIKARFEGEITQLMVGLGQTVRKGDVLMRVESNESLRSFAITAPMDGVVSGHFANQGEQTAGRTLLELTSATRLVAELAVFPSDLPRVAIGMPVALDIEGVATPFSGVISGVRPYVNATQASIFLVDLDNSAGLLRPGQFVQAKVQVASYRVPLAVKRTGLQGFRDFTVVYAKHGEQYEVRMLVLGRVGGEWVEVLDGLPMGSEYVVDNSYIIKADIDKSGASHDH